MSLHRPTSNCAGCGKLVRGKRCAACYAKQPRESVTVARDAIRALSNGRAKTIAPKAIARAAAASHVSLAILDERPVTRGECESAERPCPFVGCKHHLYLDVHPTSGSIKLNFPGIEPEDLVESCALDVADRGGANFDEVAALLNVSRQRIDQLEKKVLEILRRSIDPEDLS